MLDRLIYRGQKDIAFSYNQLGTEPWIYFGSISGSGFIKITFCDFSAGFGS